MGYRRGFQMYGVRVRKNSLMLGATLGVLAIATLVTGFASIAEGGTGNGSSVPSRTTTTVPSSNAPAPAGALAPIPLPPISVVHVPVPTPAL